MVRIYLSSIKSLIMPAASRRIFLIVSIFLISAPPASAQSFNKTFAVNPESSELEIINQTGSIKVSASTSTAGPNAARITVTTKQTDAAGRVNAVQTPQGKIKIEVAGRGPVDFEIIAPASTRLDLLNYKGPITIANSSGAVRARVTTEGAITLTGIRSAKVEAHNSSGSVSFAGDVLPNGDYLFKSFSGRVDVTFPANADFRLSASSVSGVMDLGGFPMKFERQTSQLVEASCGTGQAKVFLWTKEGGIYLHRKP